MLFVELPGNIAFFVNYTNDINQIDLDHIKYQMVPGFVSTIV